MTTAKNDAIAELRCRKGIDEIYQFLLSDKSLAVIDGGTTKHYLRLESAKPKILFIPRNYGVEIAGVLMELLNFI